MNRRGRPRGTRRAAHHQQRTGEIPQDAGGGGTAGGQKAQKAVKAQKAQKS